MIDTNKEQLIKIKDVPRLLPNRPHISTIIRWTKRGVGGVKLESVKFGRVHYTSKEALCRFATKLGLGYPNDHNYTSVSRTTRKRQIKTASRRTEQILNKSSRGDHRSQV